MPAIVSVVDEGLGNSSYLVDIGDRRALVLDPNRDPTGYLATAAQRGLEIAYTVETHLHADFVSGSRELAARGARVVAPAAGKLSFRHRGVAEGDDIDLGGLRLRALATPGHTPEHLAYVLADGDQPLALFSGGSLLVGTVARTDLIDPADTEALARDLWRSLHARVLTLPDDLPVYPTHGAGSFCSAPAGSERTTTIGRERRTNVLLRAADEDDFVSRLIDGLGSYPAYFSRLREVNRRGPGVYGPGRPTLPPIDVATAQGLVADGGWVIDARPFTAYAAGHIPGAVSIVLRPAFATWLGWVVPADVPLVFVLDDSQDRAELVRQARKVGYEQLAGELAGGMATWHEAGLRETRTPLLRARDLRARRLLDVRQEDEFLTGHIPGAEWVELGALPAIAPQVRGEVALMCGHGERAATAASILERAGNGQVHVVVGGPADWAAARGQPLRRT